MRTEAIDWLGVLATEEEIRNNNLGRSNCIVNKWDTLQFYLKVISRMPGQASNTQYVVCYSNRLDNEANDTWECLKSCTRIRFTPDTFDPLFIS